MVWRHGKNTQFKVLCQGAKWAKWRWSVIFCCFLFSFFYIEHMLFFKGQLSNLYKLDKIANINTGWVLALFFFPSMFFSPSSCFKTLFCLVNPLPEFFRDGNSETKWLHQGYQGQVCVMVFDSTSIHWANTNSIHLLQKILMQLLKRHFSSMFCKDLNICFNNAVSFKNWIFF